MTSCKVQPPFLFYFIFNMILHISDSQPQLVKNENSRNEPWHVWLNDFPQGCPDHSVRKGQSFQQIVLENSIDYHMQKSEIGPLPNTMYKN